MIKQRILKLLAVMAVLLCVAAVPALAQSSTLLVSDVSPNGGSANVAANSNISATFNMRMDRMTINSTTFYLIQQGSTSVVPAQVTYSGTTRTATLNPDANLAYGATYTAFVKGGRTGVKGAGGQKLGGTTDATATFANAKVSWTFTVTTPPETTIDSGPSGTVADRSASFSFSSSKANSSFQCRLDGASYASCTSPQIYSGLADGSHTFRVRAIDALGNVDPTPARRTWTVDATGPVASITDGPPSLDNSRSAIFAFSGAEPGGGYECKIGSAASTGTFSACTSGDSFTVGTDGTYTFSVRASDALGNFGTPDSYTWTVDTIAPTINNVSPADKVTAVAPNTNVTATFSEAMNSSSISDQTFTLKEQGSVSNLGATVSYDATTKKATLDPSTDLTPSTTYTATITTGVKDSAGNTLAQERSWTFTTDVLRPTVVSYAPPGSPPPGVSTNVTATFSTAMDPDTITTNTFTLTRVGFSVPLAAHVTYDSASKTATLDPDVNLSDSTSYTAVIKSGSDGVKDLQGNSLAQDFSWTFMPCTGGIILSAQSIHTQGIVVCG